MRRGGGPMGERPDEMKFERTLPGRGCGVKKRRLETYADVVQKQKESQPTEPLQDKTRVLTTLMKVKSIRRKIARRSSLHNLAEDYALSASCEAAMYHPPVLNRLPYTRSLSDRVSAC